MLSKIWVGFLVIACVGGALFGQMGAVSQAAAQGAGQAVGLLIEMIGLMMFWSGIMELVSASGLGQKIAHAMQPLLRCIFRSRWTGFPKHGAGQLQYYSKSSGAFQRGNPARPAGGRPAYMKRLAGAEVRTVCSCSLF